mmetsp:Transcript_15425/g.30333  ORF Transcript_15425/g.30333 Transcript_15425/m.30333 type:complete len:89 (-) Transcript_15425:204-470(-)|eukprot:CAMPEP_0175152630 /NCGR_PEP_ID=MMETSP0087-20121206/19227_1 /TAXON_ID=136419 /ORGANISM="Unknown Unknown, Strain D1" /LENGTH=88 /DNA_ID=CAMNT_0016439097 /DNA_START=34 /DNA_END=300 /DNA_ORIENTATION=+
MSISNGKLAAGLIAFVGGMALVPNYFTNRIGTLQNSPNSLAGSQTMRGNYLNTGTKDIGVDPNFAKHLAAAKERNSWTTERAERPAEK